MSINEFGRTFVVDRSTNIIILRTRFNQIAKFVTSCILDTYTIQIPDHRVDEYNELLTQKNRWARIVGSTLIEEVTTQIPISIIEKSNRSTLLMRGYYLLLHQVKVMETSNDDIAELSTEQLLLYTLNKDRFVYEYANLENLSTDIAEKHLAFLAESLLSLKFRGQQLMWQYSKTLRNVYTSAELEIWNNSILTDTVYIGQV